MNEILFKKKKLVDENKIKNSPVLKWSIKKLTLTKNNSIIYRIYKERKCFIKESSGLQAKENMCTLMYNLFIMSTPRLSKRHLYILFFCYSFTTQEYLV